MAEWNCQRCGWKNASKWDTCANCGMPKNPTREQLSEIEAFERAREDFLLTTTSIIQGMRIDKYLGIVTGVVVLGSGFYSELTGGIADILGTRAGPFQEKLNKARGAAINEMIEEAFSRKANAVVGVDLDFMEIGNNMLMVSASGTAVIATIAEARP